MGSNERCFDSGRGCPVSAADDVREAADAMLTVAARAAVLQWPGVQTWRLADHSEALTAAADRLAYLERALAAERLDPAVAPPGWVVSSGQWYHPERDILVSRSVGKEGARWVRVEGGGRGCLYPCAWDAIGGEVDDE
jgi:hypothetical protein